MAEEKKKLSPLTVAAGAAASITSMLLGSFLGNAGTIFGAALSSITCTAGAFWYENTAHKAHARLLALRAQGKADAEPSRHPLQLKALPLGENALIRARTARELRQVWGWRRKLAVLGGMLAVCVIPSAVTLIAVESATGKTLYSDFGGPAQYGTTIGGYTAPRSPSAVPQVTSSPSLQPSSPEASASLSASPEGSSASSTSPVPSAASPPGGSPSSSGSLGSPPSTQSP